MSAVSTPVSRARGLTRDLLERARSLSRSWEFDGVLFALALAVFALTRLVGLERFPIYFFTDEAIQAVHAREFVENGFRDADGRLFPTFFQNASYWNLSTSVYAQIIPSQLFGYSVFATRATSALIALTAAAAISLTLRDVFKARAWWLGGLLLAVTPAFFFHSRTAFETVIGASMFAWFLYFYLRYLVAQGPNLYFALVFGALAFYSYAPLQLVVVATGAAFGLSNLRLHLRESNTSLWGVALLLLLAAPYLRFYLDQGQEPYLHLRTLDSYWVKPGLTVEDKLESFVSEYRLGLSPAYWFDPEEEHDLVRHRMKGYGHISIFVAPFIAIGVAACIWRIRSAPHRAVLIATLLAPLGASLVAIQITRAMVMVVPAALLAGIGAALVVEFISRRIHYQAVAVTLFSFLALFGLFMLTDALRHGDTWYDDYGLYGMQYGARQVAAEIDDRLEESPDSRVVLSPSWANGTDVIFRFLLDDDPRVRLRSLNDYKLEKLEIEPNTLFIVPPWEFEPAMQDPRFDIELVDTIPYPNGVAGFFLLHLGYSAEADAIFAAEAEERRKPVTETLTIAGTPATVTFSRLDIGALSHMFDDDTFTLGRTIEANPSVIDIMFDEPREFDVITLKARTLKAALTVLVYPQDGSEPLTYSTSDAEFKEEVELVLTLPEAPPAQHYRIEVLDLNSPPDDGHVHVRDIILE